MLYEQCYTSIVYGHRVSLNLNPPFFFSILTAEIDAV